jgi:hypothetical protein
MVEGWRLSRGAVVVGLNPDGSRSGPQVMADALAAVEAVTGARGSTLWDISVPYGWPPFLESFGIPELDPGPSGTLAKVRVNYRGYPLSAYSLSASLFQVETNLDADGDPVTVAYTYPSDYHPDPRGVAGTTETQGGLFSDNDPEPSFTFKFVLVSVTGVSALYQASQFALLEGKVNKDPYTIGAISGAARTWKWTGFSANTNDGNFTMEVSITATYRVTGWDPVVCFINPDTGKPPPDVVANVGYKRPKGPPEVAFPILVMNAN